MADEKPITAGDAGPLKLPTITIPATVQQDEQGWPAFTIQTPAGDIAVGCYWRRAKCRGSVDALVSAGFMQRKWAPGLDGNNSTRQTVAFEETGPRLILGSRKGIQTKGPHIVIARKSRRTLVVEVPLTVEQQEWVKAKSDEEKRVKQAAPAASMTTSDARWHCCQLVESAIDWLRKGMADTGCQYSDESMNRIHLVYEELRKAFADGRIVVVEPATPKYQRVGNVICWPGRGNVVPVAPASLQ